MANRLELRHINRNIIYRCIHGNDELSRQEISNLTGLSIPTVIQNLTELEQEGLIRTDGVFESTGGRRAQMIRCEYDAAYAVGIDITKNHLTILIVDLKGRIRWGGKREKYPFRDDPVYYNTVCTRLNRLIKNNGIEQSRIIGAGISLPSIVDREKDRVTYGRILNEPFNIRDIFAERLPFPVSVFNDANSGGCAETWQGEDSQMEFYLMLSNSVGGATIKDGAIYVGNNSRSSEIGHVKLQPGGKPCYCGQKGCVNAYLSAKILSDPYEGRLEEFFEQLESGNAACRKMFNTYLDNLAITVVNLRMLYDCEIILGGYVGAFMDKYMDELDKRLIAYNPYDHDCAYVRPCRYKTEASAVGAALPFISGFVDRI